MVLPIIVQLLSLTSIRPCWHAALQLFKPVHPARANLRNDFVRTETCAWGKGHFVNPACQLSTTVIGGVTAPLTFASIRNFWPLAAGWYTKSPWKGGYMGSSSNRGC